MSSSSVRSGGRIWAAGLLLLQMSLGGVASAQATIPDGSPNGFSVPGTGTGYPQVFKPMRAVPQLQPPPGGAPNPFYEPRVSGVFGFVDPASPTGPAYDTEYYLIGRGDGMFLIEATPDPINGPAVVDVADLAPVGGNLRGDFIPNPLAAAPYPAPPFTANSPTFQHPAGSTAYTPWSECAVLRDASTGTFYAYGSMGGPGWYPGLWVVPLQRTTVGGASVLRFNSAAASWWSPTATAVNAANPVEIPNVHNLSVDAASGLIFLCTNHHMVATPVGDARHPYSQTFFVLDTNPPASLAQPQIRFVYYYGAGVNGPGSASLDHMAHPHDAYVKDGKVYVSSYGVLPFVGMQNAPLPCVDEYWISDLLSAGGMPIDAGPSYRNRYFSPTAWPSLNTAGLDNQRGPDTLHSCYKVGSTLWMVCEKAGYQLGWIPIQPGYPGRVNVAAVDLARDWATGVAPASPVYQPHLAAGRPTLSNAGPRLAWESQQQNLGGHVNLLSAGAVAGPSGAVFAYRNSSGNLVLPNNVGMFGIVHHIRGVAQTGFQAHYVDGVDVVDLSEPAIGATVLGSFDTTVAHIQDEWWIGHPGQMLVETGTVNAAHAYLGVYDVWPHQDSGLICLAAGTEGAIIMRVDQGHLNRYWRATPFSAGASSPGVAPRLSAENGPPRQGRQFMVRDANRLKYTSGGAGQISYRYQLHVSFTEPLQPPVGPNAQGYFENVTPTWTFGPQADDLFVFPAAMVPPQGTRVFMQMVVVEGTLQGDSSPDSWVPSSPSRVAASRGCWFGVARL